MRIQQLSVRVTLWAVARRGAASASPSASGTGASASSRSTVLDRGRPPASQCEARAAMPPKRLLEPEIKCASPKRRRRGAARGGARRGTPKRNAANTTSRWEEGVVARVDRGVDNTVGVCSWYSTIYRRP